MPASGAGRRFALPRHERLVRSGDFRRVLSAGRSYHGELLVVFTLAAADEPRRFGFVAGRRVGDAVRRNRAKRLLREALRLVRPRLAGRGYLLVLVARRGCAESARGRVSADLERQLRRAGLITDPDPGSGASVDAPSPIQS